MTTRPSISPDPIRSVLAIIANLCAPGGVPTLPLPLRSRLVPGWNLGADGRTAFRFEGDPSFAVDRWIRDSTLSDDDVADRIRRVVAPVTGVAGLARVRVEDEVRTIVIRRRDGACVRWSADGRLTTTPGGGVMNECGEEGDETREAGFRDEAPGRAVARDERSGGMEARGEERADASSTCGPGGATWPPDPEDALIAWRDALATALGFASRPPLAADPDAVRALPATLTDAAATWVLPWARTQLGVLRGLAQRLAVAPWRAQRTLTVRVEAADPAWVALATVDALVCLKTACALVGVPLTMSRIRVELGGRGTAATPSSREDAWSQTCALLRRWIGDAGIEGAGDDGTGIREAGGDAAGARRTVAGAWGPVAVSFEPAEHGDAAGRADLAVVIDERDAPVPDDLPSWVAALVESPDDVFWVPDQLPTTEPPLPAADWLAAPSEKDLGFVIWRWWGHPGFRPGQWPIVERALTGRSTLGILPTGAGKTICFQLPALVLGGLTLVVSPLQSLIDDQVENLVERGLRVAVGLHANRSTHDVRRDVKRMRRGRCVMVYLSPERFQSRSFTRDLEVVFARGTVPPRFLVLDEAHLASEWGHDFRPSYLNLPTVCTTLFAGTPTLLLTATASAWIRRDLVRSLRLPPDATILPDDFDRPELAFVVRRVGDDDDMGRTLLDVLRTEVPTMLGADSFDALHAQRGTSYAQGGLVFTPWTGAKARRRPWLTTEGVAEALAAEGLPTEKYHGGLERDARQRSQRVFRESRAPIMIATKGFGTGIDKPNVRWAFHMGYAGSLEAYYQEAGRVGRDRGDARAIALWQPRLDACRPGLAAPPCAGDGQCPLGLPSLCSFGVQAALRGGTLRGSAEDVQIALALWRRLLARRDDTGTSRLERELTLPLRASDAPGPDPSPDATLSDATMSNIAASDAPASEPSGPPPPAERSVAIGSASVEHALLRLRSIGLVGRYWYGTRPTEWSVDGVVALHQLRRETLRSGLVDALEGILEPDDLRARLARWSSLADNDAGHHATRDPDVAAHPAALRAPSVARAAAEALRLVIEAWYETIGLQSWQMLENMEEFAAATDCRRNRIVSYMNEKAPPVLGGCGRCDNCGIVPLEAVVARRMASRAAERAAARLEAFHEATEGHAAADLAARLALVDADELPALRAALQRHLEERPAHLHARLALAAVRDRLGEHDRARADVAVALRTCADQRAWARLLDHVRHGLPDHVLDLVQEAILTHADGDELEDAGTDLLRRVAARRDDRRAYASLAAQHLEGLGTTLARRLLALTIHAGTP